MWSSNADFVLSKLPFLGLRMLPNECDSLVLAMEYSVGCPHGDFLTNRQLQKSFKRRLKPMAPSMGKTKVTDKKMLNTSATMKRTKMTAHARIRVFISRSTWILATIRVKVEITNMDVNPGSSLKTANWIEPST